MILCMAVSPPQMIASAYALGRCRERQCPRVLNSLSFTFPGTRSSTTSYHACLRNNQIHSSFAFAFPVSMAQTYYRRPYSVRWVFSIALLLTILFLVLSFTLAPSHPAALAVLTVDVLFGLVAGLLDPYTAVVRKKTARRWVGGACRKATDWVQIPREQGWSHGAV